MSDFLDPAALGALLSVVLIDLTMAGDNAIIVGMAAALLPPEMRKKVILFGTALATLLRVVMAFVAVQLLQIIGLTLAGSVLLLWVAWKFYRDIRAGGPAAAAHAVKHAPKRNTMRNAIIRIALADLSMSLDNVLAVAGAAHDHLWVMIIGLTLSVALMAVASQAIAKLLARYHWIAWIGLLIVTGVALKMIYEGSVQVAAHIAA